MADWEEFGAIVIPAALWGLAAGLAILSAGCGWSAWWWRTCYLTGMPEPEVRSEEGE